jgi:hypothetical protein
MHGKTFQKPTVCVIGIDTQVLDPQIIIGDIPFTFSPSISGMYRASSDQFNFAGCLHGDVLFQG